MADHVDKNTSHITHSKLPPKIPAKRKAAMRRMKGGK